MSAFYSDDEIKAQKLERKPPYVKCPSCPEYVERERLQSHLMRYCKGEKNKEMKAL